MKMPPNSPDMETARDRLHEGIADIERRTLDVVDDLAKSGIADKRWCAIARTNIEQGIMALHRALRDYPGDDPNNYGKVALDGQLPRQFTPPTGGDREMAQQQGRLQQPPPRLGRAEWKDRDADAGMDKPQPPFE